MKSKTRNVKTRTKAKAGKPKVVTHKAPKGSKGPQEFTVTIYSSSGKEVGKFPMDKSIFTGRVDNAILYQVVLMYNANRRQGNASTKTRGDISGGGKKPWRQKGTGRARAGSTRSPLWRHGGVIFGPHTRDFHYELPTKIKRRAFLSIINSKLNENKVIGIDSIKLGEPKTKKFKAIMDALKLKGKSLFIVDAMDENLKKASGNLEEAVVKNYKDFNTMDVLACDNLVMSKVSLENLSERVKV